MVHITLLIFSSAFLFISFSPSNGYDYIAEVEKVFKEYENWDFIPIGKTASEFVQSFITSPIYDDLKKVIKSLDVKDFSKIIYSVIFQTFFRQIPVAINAILCMLTALVLIAFPCFISLYRNRQKSLINDPDTQEAIQRAGKNGWILFECFIAFFAIAVFGVLIALYASIRAYYMLPAPFKFAAFTVNATYDVKFKQQHNYEYKIDDISQGPFDRIMLLYNINDEIVDAFNLVTQANINPILNLATSMQWQISHAKYTMEHQQSLRSGFVKNTSRTLATHLSEFFTAVEALNNASKGDSSKLDSLLKIPHLNVTNDTVKTYDKPIRALKDAAKLNLQGSVQEVNLQMLQIVMKVRYNPSELIEKLKIFVFETQEKVRTAVFKYFSLASKSINKTEIEPMIKELADVETAFIRTSYSVFVIIFSLCALILVSVLILAMVYCCGVLGTKGFSLDDQDNIQRSNTSNRSGYVLLCCCYAISFFLWLCWLFNVYFFLVTALHLEVCESLHDLSFFTATLDNVSYRKSTYWFSIFSSEELNSTIKENIILCQKDNDSFSPLSHYSVDLFDAEKFKLEVNFTDVMDSFNKEITKVSNFNISSSESTISDLKHILDEVDTNSLPKALTEFLEHFKNASALEILGEIQNSSKSSANISSKAGAAIQSYESLLSGLTSSIYENDPYKVSIKSVNVTLQTVVKQMEYLSWASDVWHDFLVNKSSESYSNILIRIIHNKIDEIFLDLKEGVSKFRKSISFCRTLLFMYQKSKAVICNLLLYPISVCWFGFTLLCISVLVAVLISVFSVPLFVYPSEKYAEEEIPEHEIQPEDIPTLTAPRSGSESNLSSGLSLSSGLLSGSVSSQEDIDSDLEDNNPKDRYSKSSHRKCPVHGSDNSNENEEESSFSTNEDGSLKDNNTKDETQNASNSKNKNPKDRYSKDSHHKCPIHGIDNSKEKEESSFSNNENGSLKSAEKTTSGEDPISSAESELKSYSKSELSTSTDDNASSNVGQKTASDKKS